MHNTRMAEVQHNKIIEKKIVNITCPLQRLVIIIMFKDKSLLSQ